MKTLVFGGRGYLGKQFLEHLPGALPGEADIADPHAVAEELDRSRPDVVINAAGKTGRPNVDWCEDHKLETVRSNVTGPLVLLEECAKRGIYWVHLSSGCMYEGDNAGKGFSEDDPPNFTGSFYSRSKAWADQILREFADQKPGMLILRLRMPFDGSHNERNLIMKLKKYDRVLDASNSLTCLPDFFDAASALIEHRRTGVYNVVNAGTISPFDIVELYKEIVDPSHRFERLTLSELPQVVRAGRSNCVLSIHKLATEGIIMRPVEDAVIDSLREMARKPTTVVEA
jgi:dTDP-4-dehydrorhamnose reductase